MTKYFSMFSGIGGFEKGIEQAFDEEYEETCKHCGCTNQQSCENGCTWIDAEVCSNCELVENAASKDARPSESESKSRGRFGEHATCIGYSEIDKYAIKVYERHYNGHKNYGDATTINTSELPDFDLLVGGFPCQAFSVAGQRRGFEDTRGTLFFDVARVLRDKRPRHFILENVKGLLSHDTGKTFQTILEVLTDTGYDVSWSVHNSKNYGVPQNRERVYIIGNLRGEPRPQVFPIRAGSGEIESTVHPTVDANYYKGPSNQRRMIRQLNKPVHSNDRVYGTDGLSPTLNTMQGGLRQPFIAAVLTPDRPEKRQNGRRFKDNEEPAFTLTAQDRHGVYNGISVRRLTPLECERLQGFPDNWTAGESDTQRYKMCGNAVTVNTVEAVMRGLLNHD